MPPFVLTGYIFLAFAIYTAVPIIGTYVTKQKFVASDIIVVAVNTFVSCITMYIAFTIFDWVGFMGLLSLVYAVVYFWLALLLWMKFEGADTMRDLAALTGLVFVILTIPFQFDIIWLSLGWLLQGTALCIYGIIRNKRRVRNAGMVIFGLCIGAFLLADISLNISGAEGFHFGFRYLSVTAGSLLILATLIFKNAITNNACRAYKYATLANLWFYLLYLVNQVEVRVVSLYPFNIFYMAGVMQVVLTFALAFWFLRVKHLYDSGTRLLAFLLYFTGITGLFALNLVARPALVSIGIRTGHPLMIMGAATVIVLIGGLAVYCLYDLLKRVVARGGLRLDYIYVVIAVYILAVMTQNLLFHYRLPFDGWMISVVYVFAALSWVVFGFYKRVVLMRRFGLALALLTVVKAFLVDLTGLSQGQRVISLFVMGAALVGISFVYQLFSKRLELRVEIPEDVAGAPIEINRSTDMEEDDEPGTPKNAGAPEKPSDMKSSWKEE